MNKLMARVLGLSLLLNGYVCLAQDGCPVPSREDPESDFVSAVECLGSSIDRDEFTDEILELLGDIREAAQSRPTGQQDIRPGDVRPVARRIQVLFAERASALPGDESLLLTRQRSEQLTARIGKLALLLEFGDMFAEDLDDSTSWRFQVSGGDDRFGRLDSPRERPDPEDIYLADFYSIPCGASSLPSSCQSGISAAVEAVRAVNLTRAALALLDVKTLERLRAESRLRRGKWQAYFGEALVQYPWELGVNGRLFARVRQRIVDAAESSEPPLLRDPPSWQLILAHPDAAFEYVDAAADGHTFKAAVLVEVIGINKWRWDAATGSTLGALGISVGALYADRAGVRDGRIAVTIHVRQKYSFGVSARSGDVGIFFNVPLTERFRKSFDGAKERFSLGAERKDTSLGGRQQ